MHLGAVLEAYEKGKVLLTGHKRKNKKEDDPESSGEGALSQLSKEQDRQKCSRTT